MIAELHAILAALSLRLAVRGLANWLAPPHQALNQFDNYNRFALVEGFIAPQHALQALSGFAANRRNWRGHGMCPGWELCSDSEDGMDEVALRYRVTLSDPADLTFTDCVHRVVTFDRSAGTLRGPESEAPGDRGSRMREYCGLRNAGRHIAALATGKSDCWRSVGMVSSDGHPEAGEASWNNSESNQL